MTYYSRELKKPKNMREGFSNFVQMIINKLEAGSWRHKGSAFNRRRSSQ